LDTNKIIAKFARLSSKVGEGFAKAEFGMQKAK
jgi:hypothetical protein